MLFPRFSVLYQNEIRGNLSKLYGYKNPHQIPALSKVVLNMGVGDAALDSKVLPIASGELALISGQKPLIMKAKKSIATFKLRAGMPIGCKVTLRKSRMFEFLERLVLTVLPRIREFRGLSETGFDKRGNFSFGLKEQLVFPEIDYDKVSKVRGMDITIVTSARTDQEARSLLEGFHLPFVAK